MNRKALIAGLIVLALASGAGFIALHRSCGAQSEAQAVYQCAMHPRIVSKLPGNCPICGMALIRVGAAASAEPVARSVGRRVLFYRSPMDPNVTSPTPAKDPMGMDFVPVYADEAAAPRSSIPGHAGFDLSPEREQVIGVKWEKVERRPLTHVIRAVGRVAYDPELYNAIAEYREAVLGKEKLKDSPLPDARERADALIKSSTLRLRLLGLSPAQIDALTSRDGNDDVSLLLPGKTVWVYAQIFEDEADLVKRGQAVSVTIPSAPGPAYAGRISSIDPVVDPATRTLRVRAEIQTPEERLKPESFVEVKIEVPLGTGLAVPIDAVLDTGERQIVFVRSGDGHFEPRAVRVGREAQGDYEIRSGLNDGEEVVVSANFLIDSESRFQSAAQSFSQKGGGHD